MEVQRGIVNEMGFVRRKPIETNFNVPQLTNDEKMGGSEN